MMRDGLPGFAIDGFEAAELARWHDGLARDALQAGDGEQHDMHDCRAHMLRRYARRWAEQFAPNARTLLDGAP